MLGPEHRLRASDDFRTAVRRGARVGRRLVVVHAVPATVEQQAGSGTDACRVGFVVSRSVGIAVVRNTVKRRLRHLMRERLDRLPAGSRVVVRARPESAHATSAALARDLDVAIDRLSARMAH